MQDKPIKEARFLDERIVEVYSESGSMVRLNMNPFLHTTRFSLLKRPEVWETGTTDGVSIIWPGVTEMSYEEITKRTFW